VTEDVCYDIQVQEQLDNHWSSWFDGLTLSQGEGGGTLLHGPVADQAALYGLLDKMRDPGLTLLSVSRGKRQFADAPPGQTRAGSSCM
jgi:hypothetical protein